MATGGGLGHYNSVQGDWEHCPLGTLESEEGRLEAHEYRRGERGAWWTLVLLVGEGRGRLGPAPLPSSCTETSTGPTPT